MLTAHERVKERLVTLRAERERIEQSDDEQHELRRWEKRRWWGKPRQRRPPKVHVDKKARPRARCRQRRRVRRVRRFTGPSGHRRRSDAELRRMLKAGAFAGWLEQNIRDALDSKDRAVLICASCSGITMVPRAELAEKWAKHCGTTHHEHDQRHDRLSLPGLLTGNKRERRRKLRTARRMHRQSLRRGMLAEVRAHAADKAWGDALDAFAMADRYWVGGTGTWDASDTSHWSATSGGASGASVPTAADDVKVDGSSGSPTITLSGDQPCRSFDSTGAICTISWNNTSAANLSIGDASGGALTFSATTTISGLSNTANALRFVSTSDNGGAGWAITFNGATGPFSGLPTMTFNGVGGKWVFQDAATISTSGSGQLTLSAGTLDTNGQTVSAWKFSSTGSSTRTLTLGASSLSFSGTATAWALTGTSVTFNSGTSTITLSGAATLFNMGATAANGYYNVVLSGSGTVRMSPTTNNSVSFNNLTRTGMATKTDGVTWDAGSGSVTVAGVLTLTGNSAVNRLLAASQTFGTARTITVNGSVSLTNVDFTDITAAGSVGTWTGTSLGNALGNSNITFDAPTTQTHTASAGGNWSDPTKWTSRVPLPQDTVVVGSNTTGTLTADMPRMGADINFTGFAGTLADSANVTIYGSVTLGAGMTWNVTFETFSGRGSHIITHNGKGFPGGSTGVTIAAPGGTYTYADSGSAWAANMNLTAGTLDTAGFAVKWNLFITSGTITRAVTLGSSAITMTRTSAGAIWSTSGTGFTLTAGTSVISITGSPGSPSTVTMSHGGVTMPHLTVAAGSNLTAQFVDAFTTAGTITLTSGTLETNGQSVSCSIFSSSNSNTRTLTLGAAAMTLTGSSTTVWTTSTITGLTVTANTAIVTANGAAAGITGGGGLNFNGTSFVMSGSGSASWGSTNTVADFTRIGSAAKTDTLSVAGGNVTVTGTLTITGNSTVNRVLVHSSVLGTARTFTVTSSVVSTNADWQDITAAGTASWDLSAATGGSGDALGNTGITFTPTATRYWVGNSGNWSDTARWSTISGGASGASVPLPQDTALIDANSISSASQTITVDMPRMGANISFAGVTNTPAFANTLQIFVYGNFTISSGVTVGNWTNNLTFAGRGAQTLTWGGFAARSLSLVAPGGTYTLQDAMSVSVGTGVFTITNGTLDSNGFAVTVGSLVSNSGLTRALTMGSSQWSLTATSGTVWNVTGIGTSFTLTTNTSQIIISSASASSRTFAGGGAAYATLSYTVASSSGALVITGANTFTNLTVTSDANAKTLTLPSATTTTVTGTLTLAGQLGTPLAVNASTGGSAANLSSPSTVHAYYVNLIDQATAGAGSPFWAHESTEGSNVSGWTFVNAVGDESSLLWNDRISVSDTSNHQWGVRTVAGDQVALQWIARAAVGDAASLLWLARTNLLDSIALQWTTRAALGDSVQTRWGVRTQLGDSIQPVWNTLSLVSDQISPRWNARTILADAVVVAWGARVSVGDAASAMWNVRAVAADALAAVWLTRALSGDTSDLRWGAHLSVADSLSLSWALLMGRSLPGVTLVSESLYGLELVTE